jgi:hypothetical protein
MFIIYFVHGSEDLKKLKDGLKPLFQNIQGFIAPAHWNHNRDCPKVTDSKTELRPGVQQDRNPGPFKLSFYHLAVQVTGSTTNFYFPFSARPGNILTKGIIQESFAAFAINRFKGYILADRAVVLLPIFPGIDSSAITALPLLLIFHF